MKTILKIVLTSFCLLVIFFSALSQVKYLSNEILSALSSNDKTEIKNAKKIKSYGDELMKEAELAEEEHGIKMSKIDNYQAEKIRQMDDKTLDIVRRSARKKIKASNYYGNANLIITSIYTKNLKELLSQGIVSDKEEFNLLMEQNASLMRTSKSIRRKALQMNNELLVCSYLMDANEIETNAINKLKEAFLLIYKDAVVDKTDVIKNNEGFKKINNVKSPNDFYYMIQIAASKESLSAKQLNKICKTNETISSEFDNGWYKYSVRKKFKSYEEALDHKVSINVKDAFILAFVDGKKVSVSEAVKLQNVKKNRGTDKKNDKTVYRLRIGISTLPASNESLKWMHSGGKPIFVVDHGGWYTYTVGNFNSKKEAKKFKKNKGLTDATVVAYKNGKLIENN